MATGYFSGAPDPYPELTGAFKAAADAINAAGGLHGHPVQLTFCDDQGSPSQAQGCAEQAVSKHDVAVLTAINNNAPSELPILQKAGIAYVGNLTQTSDDATNPVSFPIAIGAFDGAAGTGVAAVVSGCKRAATIIGTYGPLTTTLQQGIEQGLVSKGGKDVGNIVVSTSTSDYSPSVATAQGKGAQCVIGALGEADTTALISAVKQSGTSLYTVTFGSSMAPLSSLRGLATGTYIEAFGRTAQDTSPGVKAAEAQIKQYSPGTADTSNSLEAWAAVRLIYAGLQKVTGTFSASSVLTAMSSLTNASLSDIYPPYSTSKPATNSAQPRVFNSAFLIYKIAGSNTDALGTFQNLPGF